MTVGAALPKEVDGSDGVILSFIVPHGCDLRCPFCFIDQRNEVKQKILLTPTDYAKFIIDINDKENISSLCIQGHEPLLPAAFPFTERILKTGRDFNIYSSLVTNGTNLSRFTFRLANLNLNYLAVSLDASTAEVHDRQRRKAGAFNSTVEGLKIASNMSTLRGALAVASVLIPKKSEQLIGIPRLLKEYDIRRWVVNILLKMKPGAIATPVGDRGQIFKDLNRLAAEADHHGVEMVVDDEFSLNKGPLSLQSEQTSCLRVHRLAKAGSGVFRLSPDGSCSAGRDILRISDDSTSSWNPEKEKASIFLSRARMMAYG